MSLKITKMETSQKIGDSSVKEGACKQPEPAARGAKGGDDKVGCQDSAQNCKILEIGLLCVVMVVIWVSLSLPILFFYLREVSGCMACFGKPD